jgi:hypothetical protein
MHNSVTKGFNNTTRRGHLTANNTHDATTNGKQTILAKHMQTTKEDNAHPAARRHTYKPTHTHTQTHKEYACRSVCTCGRMRMNHPATGHMCAQIKTSSHTHTGWLTRLHSHESAHSLTHFANRPSPICTPAQRKHQHIVYRRPCMHAHAARPNGTHGNKLCPLQNTQGLRNTSNCRCQFRYRRANRTCQLGPRRLRANTASGTPKRLPCQPAHGRRAHNPLALVLSSSMVWYKHCIGQCN